MAPSMQKVGVVIGQLGTPDAPTPQALRPYLRQFLSDMRVIDYPPLLWQALLRGIILRTRPRRSAKLYARIWMDDGSPLLVYSRRQVELLQARLGDDYEVVLGMRYGQPSLNDAIRGLEARGIDRIVVLPMYPQYSSTTTASIYDGAYQAAAGRRCPLFNERKRQIPALRFVEPYYDHAGYIESMRRHLTAQIDSMDAPPDVTLVTFHGIPNRYVQTGDPYRAQCETTAQLLADSMGWDNSQWRLSFQSRFGPEQWLEPYTDAMIEQLAHEKAGCVLVFSPGFTTDCLETLDELGNEGREAFVEAGGSAHAFTLAPCLNANPDWIDVLAGIVRQNAAGWIEAASPNRVQPTVLGATAS